MEQKSFIKKITGSREALLFCILIVLGIVVTILNPTFFSPTNIAQIFRNNAIIMIMAVGMFCVMLTAGIDISITSTLAFSGMSIGMLQKHDIVQSTLLMFLIAMGIGCIAGLLNGLIISKGKVAPIICTMGFMYIWRGMAYVVGNSSWASGEDVSQFAKFGKDGTVGPYIILLVVYGVFFVLMKWTKFGRKIYAVGANAEAARVSGINVDNVLISAYTVMGIMAGLAGALSVSIYASAQPNMQYGKEMDVIAACVIGGVSMSGGRGTIVGTFLGSLILAIVAKALPLVNVPSIAQNTVKGVIILVVVIVNVVSQRMIDKQNLERREM